MVELYTPLEPDQVTLDLTAYLQAIALAGWQRSMPNRTEKELRYRFNPDDPVHLKQVQATYKSFARSGSFVIAHLDGTGDPIGFGLAREDVSGNKETQEFKRQNEPWKVYATIRHVCLDPEFQGKGRGARLVAAVLEAEAFSRTQILTAYAFKENKRALGLIKKLGLNLSPLNQEPKSIEAYFGPGSDPVQQYRFAGASVGYTTRRAVRVAASAGLTR